MGAGVSISVLYLLNVLPRNLKRQSGIHREVSLFPMPCPMLVKTVSILQINEAPLCIDMASSKALEILPSLPVGCFSKYNPFMARVFFML